MTFVHKVLLIIIILLIREILLKNYENNENIDLASAWVVSSDGTTIQLVNGLNKSFSFDDSNTYTLLFSSDVSVCVLTQIDTETKQLQRYPSKKDDSIPRNTEGSVDTFSSDGEGTITTLTGLSSHVLTNASSILEMKVNGADESCFKIGPQLKKSKLEEYKESKEEKTSGGKTSGSRTSGGKTK